MEEYILGIETSCDDTAVAIFSSTRGLVVHKKATQLEHDIYGGVVPEIASRSHMKTLLPLFNVVMNEVGIELGNLSAVGVTHGPGLTGSLLVGLSFAKALAYSSSKQLIGIHHIEGHILANAIGEKMNFPSLSLVVSGGHTQLIYVKDIGRYEVVGSTRDDAAGEAFDKIAKLLGLPFPGGPAIEKVAKKGKRDAFDFPRALRGSGRLDFSFSGLKTAVRLKVESFDEITPELQADIAASAQEAIVDILAEKSQKAIESFEVKHFYLAGGVAANGRLREEILKRIGSLGVDVHWPELKFCTDNAAMIACSAYYHFLYGHTHDLTLNTFPRGDIESWR